MKPMGLWADGSLWSKVIPILQNAGHRVIAVQLPLHSLADDVATVKREIDLISNKTSVGIWKGRQIIPLDDWIELLMLLLVFPIHTDFKSIQETPKGL
jgi:hypothetical protein